MGRLIDAEEFEKQIAGMAIVNRLWSSWKI